MFKKLFSFVFTLTIAFFALSIVPGSALATNNPSWHWVNQDGMDIPVDDRCDLLNPNFRVTIYEGHNQTGARARLCGYWDDLSQLPQYKGAGAPTFNNSISSMWVKELDDTHVIDFHFLKDQEGLVFDAGPGKYDMTSGFDNVFSSVNRILNQ